MAKQAAKETAKGNDAEMNGIVSKSAAKPAARQEDRHDLSALPGTVGNRAFGRLLQATVVERRSAESQQPGLSDNGQPLDLSTRNLMEARLNHDLSGVRVHTGAQSSQSARGVNARAYTIGSDIVFDQGEYQPDSQRGQRLLAHELAHVIQQERGGTTPPSLESGNHLDRAADQAAEAVTQSERPVTVEGTSAPGLARDEREGGARPTVNMYRVEIEGQTRTLTEEEYRREVARATHNLGLDFNRIEGIATAHRETHQDFLANTHGFFGMVSDIAGNTVPPTVQIWSYPRPAILRGREALQAGNLQGAARQLQLAQQFLRDAQQEWNQYIDRTTSGAARAITVLETTRDVSFAIAIGTAAVVAAPVVAAGVATTGLTGATATLATGAVVATGGAGTGAVLRGGTSAAGQALAGGGVNWSEVRGEAATGARRGFVDAGSAFTGVTAARALGVGAEGVSLGSNLVRSGGAGAASGAVGSGADATLQGRPPVEVLEQTVKGAAVGFVGGAAGTGAEGLLRPGSAGSRVLSGIVGGGTAGGLGAALEGGDIGEGILTGSISGAVPSLAQHGPAPQQPTPQQRRTPSRRSSGQRQLQRRVPAQGNSSSRQRPLREATATSEEVNLNPSMPAPGAVRERRPVRPRAGSRPLRRQARTVSENDATESPVQESTRPVSTNTNETPTTQARHNEIDLGPIPQESLELDFSRRSTGQNSPPAYNEIDLGSVPANSGLSLYRGRKPNNQMPRRRQRNTFGTPSQERGGTEHRTGAHFHEFNAAEIGRARLRIDYDPSAGRPRKITYEVHADVVAGLSQQQPETSRSFTRDTSTEGAQSRNSAYRRSGIERGHLAQREVFKGDASAERAVDHFTNIVPMTEAFNRGAGSPWRAAEGRTLDYVRPTQQGGGGHQTVRVEIEPVYAPNPPRLKDGTPIPRAVRRRVMASDGTVLEDTSWLNS